MNTTTHAEPAAAHEPPHATRHTLLVTMARKLGLEAFGISLLLHAAFILAAIFLFYKWVQPPPAVPPGFIGGGGGGGASGEAVKTRGTLRKTMMTTTAATPRIASTSLTATFSLPDASADLQDPGLPMTLGGGGGNGLGGDTGLGTGRGPGIGNGYGPGSGFGSGPAKGFFGSIINDGSMLAGTMYDMKQNAAGEPVPYDTAAARDDVFVRNIRRIIDKEFAPEAFKPFYQAGRKLHLSYLAIPGVPATDGPKAFGMENEIQPRGWFIHYSGKITPPKPGTYRWVGLGDDLLMVFIDGKLVLNASWPDIQDAIGDGWKAREFVNAHQSHQSPKLVYGNWVDLGLFPRRIDILFGERPGGLVGAVLLAQERGAKYTEGPAGRPILPPFTVKPLDSADKARLANFPGGFAFDTNPPVFRVRNH